MPVRIQRKRSRGWRKPPGTVNVTRPSKWGNPFGAELDLEVYRLHVKREVAARRLDLEELRGRDLMCWCEPGAPCHADVLLDLANR